MSENIPSTQELQVSPKKIRARNGLFKIRINNTESLTNTYHLKASDPGELCTYSFNTDTLNVAAGAIAQVTLAVSFKKTHFTGAPKVCNFTVTSTKATGEVKTADGQLECPAILPIWALVAGGLVVVAIIAVVIVLANGGDHSTLPPSNTTVATIPTTSGTNKPLPTQTTVKTTTPITSSLLTTATTKTPMPTMTTSTTTITPTLTTTTATTVTLPNIAGQWQWNLTVTVATGACAGEEGVQSPLNIQVIQNGNVVKMSGFLSSNPSTSLSGEITFDGSAKQWVVKFSGSYSEDQGTTTTNYTLVLNSTYDEMTGDENWSWVGGGGSCPGSKSTVVAKKLS